MRGFFSDIKIIFIVEISFMFNFGLLEESFDLIRSLTQTDKILKTDKKRFSFKYFRVKFKLNLRFNKIMF
jgi:hypothetical protein